MVMQKSIRVVAAGTGINLALGVLYTWSIFKESIKASIIAHTPGSFDWNLSSINDPYAVACLVFAFTMIPAGRMQDKLGPRITAFCGGILVGTGFLLISHSVNYWVWVAGFGGLVGAGIAMGYAAATPAALKWFPKRQSGLVAGIVVAGFGLASAYIAPLASYLVKHHGLLDAMLFFGIGFTAVVSLLASQLTTPPAGYTPEETPERRSNHESRENFIQVDETPSTLLKNRQFWLLWLQYFAGAGAGLMVIGSISGMAKLSMGEQAYLAVAILAIGNAAGRVLAGILSDHFGRRRVLAAVFLIQTLLMIAAMSAAQSHSALAIVLAATLIGCNYGANLAIFPSYAKDLWGMKHFGVNYGMLFTAWGVGGFVMSRVSEMLKADSGSYTLSFAAAALLLLGGLLCSLSFGDNKEKSRLALKKQTI
jgi:MFS transporter, OFA family, oxalate/formate antiporter